MHPIDEREDPDLLLGGLARYGIASGVLIGCTDIWSTALSNLTSESAPHFRMSMPRPDVIDMLVDKWSFAEALALHGVAHPRTVRVDVEDDLERAEVEHPFLKPRNSQRFNQLYRQKAFSYSTPEEGRAAFRLMAEAGLGAVVQDYIPGPPTAHLFVDGFVDRHGQLKALLARRRIRMFPPDFGNSTLMVSIDPGEVLDAVDGIERLLTGVGYRGIFSAEFKLDPRDGLHKLLEVNSRPWWYIGFAAACGVDTALMAYRDALELPVPAVTRYDVGKRCVLLRQDARAFLRLRASGELDTSSWVRSWLGARPSIFSLSDPLPAVASATSVARRRRRKAGV